MPTAYLTNTEELTQIAEAIRIKGERSDNFSFPQGFVDAIMSLRGGTEIIATNMLNNLVSGSCYFPTATYIGSYAFASCTRLTAIDLPRVSIVYNSAFHYCTSVSQVNLELCTIVSSCAFLNCSKLTSINLPECIHIGSQAFQQAPITGLDLPKCEIIDTYGCHYMPSLSWFNLPECRSLGYGGFSYCSNLLNVELPKCSIVGGAAFYACYKLQWANLPSLYSIGTYVFSKCSMLQYIRLSAASASMSRLPANIVHECLNLKSIYLDFSFVPSCNGCIIGKSRLLYGNTYTTDPAYSDIDLYVPASLYAAYKLSTYWSSFTRIYSM